MKIGDKLEESPTTIDKRFEHATTAPCRADSPGRCESVMMRFCGGSGCLETRGHPHVQPALTKSHHDKTSAAFKEGTAHALLGYGPMANGILSAEFANKDLESVVSSECGKVGSGCQQPKQASPLTLVKIQWHGCFGRGRIRSEYQNYIAKVRCGRVVDTRLWSVFYGNALTLYEI